VITEPGAALRSRPCKISAAAATLLACMACTGQQGAEPASSAGAARPTFGTGPTSTAVTPTAQGSGAPTAEPARAELPRGGRDVFPRYRLVGYAGLTGASTLGRLGTGPLDSRIVELEKRGRLYAQGREILPVLEVITTVVQGSAGRDGTYRVRLTDDKIRTYSEAASKHKTLLLLNIQPGRSEFLQEARAYEKWLKLPNVGLALDPEWAMDPGQVPGRAYGHTTGAELDQTARYLAGLVKKHDLPEKVMVYHQVATSVVRKESGLRDHAGVALIKSVDGLGPPGEKIKTYRRVNKTTPKFVHPGFKLFFTEDRRDHGRLMSPHEVLALKPRPEYVMYE
jgi:hypothetical protein